MAKRKLIPVYTADDVPEFSSGEEAAEFWDTHSITQEYWDSLPDPDLDEPSA